MAQVSARYSRQQTHSTLQSGDQEKLTRARVAVIGAGGLGSPVLTYLACAGIGYLRVIDGDIVEASNLNRQFIHSTPDIGRFKAENGTRVLRALNPEVEIEAVTERVTAANAEEILGGVGVIVDASDNHDTRILISRWAEDHGIDVVWGVIYGMSGYTGSTAGARGNAYHHLFPAPADTATVEIPAQAGVVGAACGVIGSMMAMEVIHAAVHGPRTRPAKLTYYDGGTGTVALLEPAGSGHREP